MLPGGAQGKRLPHEPAQNLTCFYVGRAIQTEYLCEQMPVLEAGFSTLNTGPIVATEVTTVRWP
jgi:hypothetical protein